MTLTLSEQILERLTRIETLNENNGHKIEELDHKLFGNGQPGEIKDLSRRIGKLESAKYWLWGVGTGSGVVIGYLFKLLRG